MPSFAVLVAAVGPVLLLVGLLLMRRRDDPGPSQAVAEGTVMRWDHTPVGATVAPRELRSLPVVRFRTADGTEVEGLPRWAADRGIYRTGHRVEVRYDRDDPSAFRVRQGWLDRPAAYVVLAGAALTFLTLVLPLALRTFL